MLDKMFKRQVWVSLKYQHQTNIHKTQERKTDKFVHFYLSVDPGVPPAMAGVDFIPTETTQLDPKQHK